MRRGHLLCVVGVGEEETGSAGSWPRCWTAFTRNIKHVSLFCFSSRPRRLTFLFMYALLDFIQREPDPYHHQTNIWIPGTRRRMCCRNPCDAPDGPALRGRRGRCEALLRRWGSTRPPTVRSGIALPSATRRSATKPWLIMKQEVIREHYTEEGSRLVLISVWMCQWLRIHPWQRHAVIFWCRLSLFSQRRDGMRRRSLCEIIRLISRKITQICNPIM